MSLHRYKDPRAYLSLKILIEAKQKLKALAAHKGMSLTSYLTMIANVNYAKEFKDSLTTSSLPTHAE